MIIIPEEQQVCDTCTETGHLSCVPVQNDVFAAWALDTEKEILKDFKENGSND